MSSVDILVPDLPESVADATVATWHKKPGDAVVRDEVLVEIETDRVVLEVPISAGGILDAVLEDEGTTITSRQILGHLRESNSAGKEISAKPEEKVSTPTQRQRASLGEQSNDALSPVIRHLPTEYNLDTSAIKDAGAGGRLTREDMEKHLAKAPAKESAPAAATPAAQPALATRSEKRVPMTCLRRCVVKRPLEAKNSVVMLTTSDGVNMKPIMDLRRQYGEVFEKHHDIRLDFMSSYVKTVVEILRRYSEVNVSIGGDDVVYHNYPDVNMAVSTPRDLVMPVLHDADTLDMADIEKKTKELAVKGRDGKLAVEDLTGSSLTITNGGMFGSLMSTSIINPSQSVVLGMHTIKDRPMTVSGQVEILPMIYSVPSYDHRLTDGRKSMGFLATVKELLEDLARLLLDVQQFKFHLYYRPDEVLSPSPAIEVQCDASASYQAYGATNVDRVRRKCRV